MSREVRIGDRVTVASGPHEGKTGTISGLKGPTDTLFDGMPRPLSGSLLEEYYALVDWRKTDFEGTVYNEQFAVPVRRLKPQ